MNETVENPYVFISYCWYKEETREWVLRLAEDLQSLGVHVTIDAWDLKEGQDVYAFMESCVTSTEINRVLIVCDKAYSQKADSRSGGVGAETAIISKKVYDKVDQTKFVPILLERAEDGQAMLPTYLASRKYIDFSSDDNYPDALEQLVRTLYGRPVIKRPALGTPPAYVMDEPQQAFSCVSIFQTFHRNLGAGKPIKDELFSFSEALVRDVTQLMHVGANEYSLDLILDRIRDSLPIRDLFFSSVNLCLRYDKDQLLGSYLHSFFEKCLELIYYSENNDASQGRHSTDIAEHLVYEFFIGSVSLLLKGKCVIALQSILDNRYWVVRNGEYRGLCFCSFRRYSHYLEESYNSRYRETNNATLHTPRGHIISEMANSPLVKMSDYVEADVFLAVKSLLAEGEDSDVWFPVLSVYNNHGRHLKIFKRATYVPGFNELLELIGVSNGDEFKKRFLTGHKRHGVDKWKISWHSLDLAHLIDFEKLGTLR